jgi:hypothetical protein
MISIRRQSPRAGLDTKPDISFLHPAGEITAPQAASPRFFTSEFTSPKRNLFHCIPSGIGLILSATAMDPEAAIAQAVRQEPAGVQTRPERLAVELPDPNHPDLAKILTETLDNWKPFGLTFSGGGIRSATCNLGVLQAREDLGLLRCVDYLSHLETEWTHPGNKGWKALFETWANSSTLWEVYKSSRGAYGSRFREFCGKRLGFPKKEP